MQLMEDTIWREIIHLNEKEIEIPIDSGCNGKNKVKNKNRQV